jgi:hypothetical protein
MNSINNPLEPPDFSLVMGGPTFQLLVRSRLADTGLGLMKKRIVFIGMLIWLPLMILSLVSGKAWGGIRLPFLYDLQIHAAMLVALPLLIASELLVNQRIRLIVGQFTDRGIITEAVKPEFRELIDSAMKLRNSVAIELILFLLIYIGGYFLWMKISGVTMIGTGTGTWCATVTDGKIHLTPAGYWYIFVSRPLFQFIVLRWYFRIFIWARFMWQTSRLELNLIPTHPDRAAGLGFLGLISAAFTPLLVAHGALLAGLMANPIFFAGAKLTDYKIEIVGVVAFLLLLVLGPLMFFSPQLMRAKRKGLSEYGILVSRYVREFDLKWVRGNAADAEPLIGSGDIQSLADMGNSFQVISQILPFPFGKDAVIQTVVFPVLPVLPLVLTMIPLEELIKKLLGAFL